MNTASQVEYRGLDTVLVSKVSLTKTLKDNRDTHVAEYKEALEGFRQKAIDSVEKHKKDVGDLAERVSKTDYVYDPTRDAVQLYLGAPPVSYEKFYTSAIRKLEMSLDDKIELNETEFESYVMDNWSWKGQFTASTMALRSYNSKSS